MNNFTKEQTVFTFINDCLVMAKRNLLKTKHNPEKLFDVTVQPLIMMVMFSFLFGGAISGSVDNYLPIIIPGVLVTSLLQASASAGIQLREDLNTGVFDRFNSLPIHRISTLAGLLVADMVRYAIAGTMALGSGYILGWRPEAGLGFAIIGVIFVIIISFALSWIFASLGLIFKSTATINGVAMLVMMVMTFISSAYIPIDTLPPFLETLASINPVTHLIEAFKAIAYTGTFNHDVLVSIESSVLIMVIFIPLTLWLFKRNIK